MRKKAVSILLTTAMTISLLTGCGGAEKAADAPQAAAESAAQESEPAQEQAQPETDSQTTAAEPTKITFWNSFTGADGDMLTDLVNRYNAENTDGITVEMDISADFDSQLSTAFAAGTGPTMILSSSAYRFTYGDYMQNISDVFDKTNLDKADFIQSYLDYCSEGDTLYFVPFQIVGYYMYWNKDLFTAAGLDPETPPSTWDEWADYAQKLTDESKNVYGSGISYDYAY